MLPELVAAGEFEGQGSPIPILIRVEPARMTLPDTDAGLAGLKENVGRAVRNGLRASLATGSLLTGSLFVSLDIYPNEKAAEVGEFAGRPTIPTISTGLEGLELKLSTFLDKLNALPLQGTVSEAEKTLAGLDKLLNSQDTQSLPGSLDATLAELQTTLASFSGESELQEKLVPTIAELDRTLVSLRQLLDTLDEQPNALIFNRAYGDDPKPPAGSQ